MSRPLATELSRDHTTPVPGTHLSQRAVYWFIAILLTAHTAEEAIAFRAMRVPPASLLPAPLGSFAGRLTPNVLLPALAVLSILALGLAAVVALRPRMHSARWLLLALETAVGINAVVHIASAVVLFRGYGPGLATAVLVNAPFAVYVLRRAKREGWVSPRAWRLLPVGGLVLHGPVLLGGLWLATR